MGVKWKVVRLIMGMWLIREGRVERERIWWREQMKRGMDEDILGEEDEVKR